MSKTALSGGTRGEMIVFYGALVYALGLAIVGVIILICFRGLRFTLGNLVLFVIGGFAGIGAAGYLMSLAFRYIAASRVLGLLAWPTVVVGACVGGTGLVWLKTRFMKGSGDK
jgi:hypothetical protein